MDDSSRKFRDRLRIVLILHTFCDRDGANGNFGVFRTEMKIQALDFLLRYPDFLCMELLDLLDNDPAIDRNTVQKTVEEIYGNHEPIIRVEEMEKFFHGAYESIDDVIAFLISVGFIRHESKRRIDGRTYDKTYYVTHECADKLENGLKLIPSVKWYVERCELMKLYFNRFSGSELKQRQYRYSEYKDISYKSHIQNVNNKVKAAFTERFHKELI